jgi:SNF2 family DNA or RNA helicase
VKLLNQSGKQFGCWENGRDYLRIDGQTSAFERGILIDQFNRKDARKRKQFYINKQAEENAKLFLLSSRAGSVG